MLDHGVAAYRPAAVQKRVDHDGARIHSTPLPLARGGVTAVREHPGPKAERISEDLQLAAQHT